MEDFRISKTLGVTPAEPGVFLLSNKPLYHILTLLFILASPIPAQQEASEVTTQVDLVSMGETIPGLYLGKKKNKVVSAQAFRYQTTLRYKGNRIIEISQNSSAAARPEPELSDEDKEHELKPYIPKRGSEAEINQNDKIAKAIAKRREKNPDLVALAIVPPSARHITILLTPAENNTYRTTVINDDPTNLLFGKMRVHNFCKHPISMRFNNEKATVIPPRKSYKAAPKSGDTISYFLGYPKNQKWKIQENNILNITPDEQVQMVVIQSKASFFKSSNGSRGGRLQVAILRRDRSLKEPAPSDPSQNDDKPALPPGLAE